MYAARAIAQQRFYIPRYQPMAASLSEESPVPKPLPPEGPSTSSQREPHSATIANSKKAKQVYATLNQHLNLAGAMKKGFRGLDRRMDDLTGSLAGPGLEAEIQSKYAAIFAKHLGIQSRYLVFEDRQKDSEWAAEFGVITKDEQEDAMRVDLVVDCGKKSHDPGTTDFLVGEVSIRVAMKDAVRAIRRAQIWERVYRRFKVRCLPMVVGKKISLAVRKDIEARGVIVILLDE